MGWLTGAIAETGWWADSKLLNGGHLFGTSVSLSGDRLVVGEHNSAYVFDYDGTNWVQTAKLLAADGEIGDEFGVSVSLSGDRMVMGAWTNEDNNETFFGIGSNDGAAYAFQALDVIDPMPDIKINGTDGPLTLSETQELILSLRLIAGEAVGNAEYWLFAETPVGTYYYENASKSWGLNIVPAAQGTIKDRLMQVLIAEAYFLPTGTTIISGGVDLTPNGVLDGPMFLDTLEVTR